VVTLAAPPGGFPPSSGPPSGSPSGPAVDPVDPTTPAGPDVAADSGSALPWVLVGVAVLAVAAVGAAVALRRRRQP
jgi:hypothetical protein